MNKMFSLILVSLFLVSCASRPPVELLPANADPTKEIERVEGQIKEARNKSVDLLAPMNFQNAEKALDSARKQREMKSSKNQDILFFVALSDAYLKKAKERAEVGLVVLKPVMDERGHAVKAKALNLQPEEMARADGALKAITRKVEKEDLSKAYSRRDVLEKEYQDIEMMSVKKAALGDAFRDMDQAIKEGAKRLTPQTLAWTQQRLDRDVAALGVNKRNLDAVERISKDGKMAAARLLDTIRQAKRLANQTPEEIAILVRKDQDAVGDLEKDLASKEGEVAALAASKEKADAVVHLEKEYEAARTKFTADEAEVYKQGDKLLLRLKGLSFPSNRAEITSNNFSILGKVQDIIKESKPAHVVIEGHTDSTGKADVNKLLSEARAQSVKEYLSANNTINPEHLSAQGFGYSKPIATNKTKEGRAQNRRIDVIISATELE